MEAVTAERAEHYGPFILAALEAYGILPSELVAKVDELARTVVPLNYAAAQLTTATATQTMPPWVSCVHCRTLFLNATAHLMEFHRSGHSGE